ncbi:MAG: hypothetical protein QNJ97_07905 [Myxococcota bacterium]|nr:hypothetical protein [Myxococcota bacterium]
MTQYPGDVKARLFFDCITSIKHHLDGVSSPLKMIESGYSQDKFKEPLQHRFTKISVLLDDLSHDRYKLFRTRYNLESKREELLRYKDFVDGFLVDMDNSIFLSDVIRSRNGIEKIFQDSIYNITSPLFIHPPSYKDDTTINEKSINCAVLTYENFSGRMNKTLLSEIYTLVCSYEGWELDENSFLFHRDDYCERALRCAIDILLSVESMIWQKQNGDVTPRIGLGLLQGKITMSPDRIAASRDSLKCVNYDNSMIPGCIIACETFRDELDNNSYLQNLLSRRGEFNNRNEKRVFYAGPTISRSLPQVLLRDEETSPWSRRKYNRFLSNCDVNYSICHISSDLSGKKKLTATLSKLVDVSLGGLHIRTLADELPLIRDDKGENIAQDVTVDLPTIGEPKYCKMEVMDKHTLRGYFIDQDKNTEMPITPGELKAVLGLGTS